jgi:hypothetical protein
MSGMSNTPKVAEARAQLIAEIYRAIMASELVSRKLGLEAERKSVRELLTEYETRLGVKPTRSPGAAIREVKKK